MCSIDSIDSDIDLMKKKEDIQVVGALCRKCTESEAAIVLQGKFPYCRQCFLLYATHKFYAVLGKSKILRPKDKILIAFSGSNSSVTLLNLVKEGLHESRKKKLVSDAAVLYIDESAVLNLPKEERLRIIQDMVTHTDRYGFDTFIVDVNCIDNDIKLYNAKHLDSESYFEIDPDNLKKTLDGIRSPTSKEDFILKLRNNILVKAAKLLDCNKIFTAETSDHLAINLLTNIALGRGAQLPQDVGFLDDRFGDVAVVRPLKDWSKKEVVFYNVFNNLSCITYTSLGTLSGPLTSIQKLTEKFITDLQDSFPSTVSTVLRTGSKIVSKPNTTSEEPCILCQGKLDTGNDGLCAEQSSKLSHRLSNLGVESFSVQSHKNEENSCKNDSGKCCTGTCKNKPDEMSTEKLSEHVCYGCQLILKEMNSVKEWPRSVVNEIQRKLNFELMRNEIQDFLL